MLQRRDADLGNGYRGAMITKMWLWGFAAGVFLMAAIQALAGVLAGDGVVPWVQMLASILVVIGSLTILLRERKGQQP